MTETQGWVLIAIVAIIALSGGLLLRLVLIEMDRIVFKLDQVHDEVIHVRLAADELLSVTHIMESRQAGSEAAAARWAGKAKAGK